MSAWLGCFPPRPVGPVLPSRLPRRAARRGCPPEPFPNFLLKYSFRGNPAFSSPQRLCIPARSGIPTPHPAAATLAAPTGGTPSAGKGGQNRGLPAWVSRERSAGVGGSWDVTSRGGGHVGGLPRRRGVTSGGLPGQRGCFSVALPPRSGPSPRRTRGLTAPGGSPRAELAPSTVFPPPRPLAPLLAVGRGAGVRVRGQAGRQSGIEGRFLVFQRGVFPG